MGLREKATAMNNNGGIDFMEGREKGEIKPKKLYTVCDFDFINGDDGEYVVFVTLEDNKNFYFGGSVITDKFKKFTEEDKAEIISSGLPTLFEKRSNKAGKREYMTAVFFPEE